MDSFDGLCPIPKSVPQPTGPMPPWSRRHPSKTTFGGACAIIPRILTPKAIRPAHEPGGGPPARPRWRVSGCPGRPRDAIGVAVRRRARDLGGHDITLSSTTGSWGEPGTWGYYPVCAAQYVGQGGDHARRLRGRTRQLQQCPVVHVDRRDPETRRNR